MPIDSVRRAVVGATAAAALIAASALGGALPASAAVVDSYDTIQDPPPWNSPSLAYYSNSITEFGAMVELAPGTDRSLYDIEIGFSNWSCETGFYQIANDPCVTTPGSSFTHPITVNLYEDDGSGFAGYLIATVTDTVTVPFRPSASPECAENKEKGQYYADGACYSGLFFTWIFDFSGLGITLPERFTIGVTYDTSGSGYAPIGPDPIPGTNRGYDALNVAIEGVAPPAAGTFTDEFLYATMPANGLYIYSGWGEFYSLQATVRTGVPDPEPAPGLTASGSADPTPAVIGAGVLALLGAIVLIGVQRRHSADRRRAD